MSDAPSTVERFCGLADAYERHRPSYPQEAVAAILAGLPPAAAVADVGAGTGISTRALAAAGARAIAIEPNAEMRAIAVAQGSEGREGSAQATGLGAASVDAVTVFQAFHWFAQHDVMLEFARILRRPGRIALVWNERDLADAFTSAFRDLERQHGEGAMLAGIDFHDEQIGPLLRGAGFGDVRLHTFPNVQRLDRDTLVGRVRSTSYAPRHGPPLEALVADLHALHDRFASTGGLVLLRYNTEVFLADLAPA